MLKKIFVIILSWNGWKDTVECLESLEKISNDDYQISIIVVDNGSTEEPRVRLKDIEILRNKENLGFAEGNNVGIRHALKNGADYVMILNNDTLVEENLLTELLRVTEQNEKIGIAAPKIYFVPGFEYHHDRYKDNERGRVIWYAGGVIDWQNVLGFHRGVDEVDHGQYGVKEETDFTSGCCMIIRREVLEKIGLFDSKYYLYWEDNDFCQRARRADFKILYVPQAFLWHKNAGSAGGSGSDLQDYYTTRNRLLFGIRYAPLRAKLALVKESVKLLLRGRKWQKQGVIDFFFRRFGRGTYRT